MTDNNGNIRPEPPKILSHVKWFLLYGKDHWMIIVISLIIIITAKQTFFEPNSQDPPADKPKEPKEYSLLDMVGEYSRASTTYVGRKRDPGNFNPIQFGGSVKDTVTITASSKYRGVWLGTDYEVDSKTSIISKYKYSGNLTLSQGFLHYRSREEAGSRHQFFEINYNYRLIPPFLILEGMDKRDGPVDIREVWVKKNALNDKENQQLASSDGVDMLKIEGEYTSVSVSIVSAPLKGDPYYQGIIVDKPNKGTFKFKATNKYQGTLEIIPESSAKIEKTGKLVVKQRNLSIVTLVDGHLITKSISTGEEVDFTYDYTKPFLKLTDTRWPKHDFQEIWIKK